MKERWGESIFKYQINSNDFTNNHEPDGKIKIKLIKLAKNIIMFQKNLEKLITTKI